jgi:hypothetical protein
MKKRYWGIFFPYCFIFVFFLKSEDIQGQCAAYTIITHCTTAAPSIIGNSITCTPPIDNGGRRNFLVTNMIAGNIYRISNCGSGFDTQLTVFNNDGTVNLAYNDDGGPACDGTAASIDYTAPYTGDFRIQLNRWNCSTLNQLNGTITVTLQGAAPPPPDNDLCSNATALPCDTTNLVGTTVNSTNLSHGTGCDMSNFGVWYTFTGDGQQTTISSTATFDHEMSISQGNCGTLTNLTCRDSAVSGGTETFTFTTVIGVQYYVYISHWSSFNTTTGTFTISRSCAPAPTPPANDLCINATPLPCGTIALSGSTQLTSNIAHGSGCSMSNYGVWYTFVGDGSVTTITSTADFDHEMSFSSGSCGSLTNISCHDNTFAPGTETASFQTTIGVNYYVYISHWQSGSSTTGNFTINRTCSVPCSQGDGNGTSTLACPSVLAGGLGLSGDDPDPVNCDEISGCVTLEAEYLHLGTTSNYVVEPIVYQPPYQFGCLQNPVSVNDDDVWSPIINLPFNFCFYGNNYNQCIISSNGVISFDTTNNIPGGYSNWSFNTNLPSPSLFLNSIFGVYHDIDPRVGGTVGWELITLNSGCRALVAAWKDMPMFSPSCNSILYTGMIVLYEDTNVIEVYIEEKNVCATWNGGRAIVGIQNASGSQGVVAPDRNALDPNWSTYQEAWRFSPSGPSITTIQWFEGDTASGPVIGTTDTIKVCPTTTTTYTAQVTYTLCNGTVLNETDQTTVTVTVDKIWNGSINSDWDISNNWTPEGIPTSENCVIIPITPNDPIVSGSGYNGLAKNLNVLNGATLNISDGNAITVTEWVRVEPNATFEIANNASLIQINDTPNSGNIIYRRNALVKRLDYVYWSSPVSGFTLNQIPAPLAPGPMFFWHPTILNQNGFEGNWLNASGQIMAPGRGYIMRAPGSFSTTTPQTLYGSFVGVPNNGPISIPVSRGNNQSTTVQYTSSGAEVTNYSDNQNLIGNPYPSAIRTNQFLFDNQDVIEGVVKLWMHGVSPDLITSPYYQDFVYNYSPDDYLIYNFVGSSCCPTLGSELFIGGGQGFFVEMKDGPAGNGTVTFDNHLRHHSFDNSFFFRTTKPKQTHASLSNQKHRFWIDIINSNLVSSRTLIGYVNDATYGKDSFYDAITSTGSHMSIFSLIDNQKYSIQGRPAPLDINDEVPIGFISPSEGTYKIALAAHDTLFDTQNIYLKDHLLDIYHVLQHAAYEFFSPAGVITNRFSIVYTNQTLGINQFTNAEIQVISNQQLTIFSKNHSIKDVAVFDLLGRQLMIYTDIHQNELTLWEVMKNNTGLMLRITLENGKKTIHKVIH